MTKKIAFIGSAGSGKSTLAADIFVELKKKGHKVELVTEWIRQDIQVNGPMTTIWEQYRVLHHQRSIEDSVTKEADWMITDSGVLTPYFYSCLYSNKANERERLVLADMFKFLIDDLYQKRYQYVFFLPGKYAYSINKDIAKDGTRYQTDEELHILDDHMRLVFTRMFKVDNIIELDVPMAKRTKEVLKVLL